MRRIFVQPEFALLMIILFILAAWYVVSSAIASVNASSAAYNARVEKSATGVAPATISPTSTPSI